MSNYRFVSGESAPLNDTRVITVRRGEALPTERQWPQHRLEGGVRLLVQVQCHTRTPSLNNPCPK
ncbi:hypothetical protein M407DRAFT_242899, partial [Tulasnella calospora MUT 4182]